MEEFQPEGLSSHCRALSVMCFHQQFTSNLDVILIKYQMVSSWWALEGTRNTLTSLKYLDRPKYDPVSTQIKF